MEFSTAETDVILRSTDNVDFRTIKSLLSSLSPVFETLFTLPQNDASGEGQNSDHLPVVPIDADGKTIRHLLEICHPGWLAHFDSGEEVRALLGVAVKYQMDNLTRSIMRELIPMDNEPALALAVFALAIHHGWKAEALSAAKYTLRFPETSFPRIEEMKFVTGLQYQELLEFHRRCGQVAKGVAMLLDDSWVPVEMRGFVWFTAHRCVCEQTSKTMFKRQWGRVRFDVEEVSNWWMDYIREVAESLMIRPSGPTASTDDLLDRAYVKASRCETCRAKVFPQLRAFGKALGQEVDKATSQVSLNI